MWFTHTGSSDRWRDAVRHLSGDPVLKRIMRQVGPCTLAPRRDHFVVLCQSIYNQQISIAAANVLFNRFRDVFPARRPTPARVIALLSDADESLVRHCGLSRQKKAYLLDLARHFVDGRFPTRRLARMSDRTSSPR